MKKSIWIFLFAVLLPGFVLGWLALRSAEEQQIIFERRTAELYQKETETMAATARDIVEAERRAFGDTVHRLLARSDAQALAKDFTNSLMDSWPRKAVGFVLGKDGEMLSPTTTMAEKNGDLRSFLWDNGSFLCSTQPAVVYPVAIETNAKANTYGQVMKSRASPPEGKPALTVSNGANPTVLAQKGGSQMPQQQQMTRVLKEPISNDAIAVADPTKQVEESVAKDMLRQQLSEALPSQQQLAPNDKPMPPATPAPAPAPKAAVNSDSAAKEASTKSPPSTPASASVQLRTQAPAAPSAAAPASPAPLPQNPAVAPRPQAIQPSNPVRLEATPSKAVQVNPLGNGVEKQEAQLRMKGDEQQLPAPAPLSAATSPAPPPPPPLPSGAVGETRRSVDAKAKASPSEFKNEQGQTAVASNPTPSLSPVQHAASATAGGAATSDQASADTRGRSASAEKSPGGGAGGGRGFAEPENTPKDQRGIAPLPDVTLNSQQSLALSSTNTESVPTFSRYNSDTPNRMVEPQQQVRSAVSNWSALLPATADFRALTAGSDEGMLARFVQDKLDLVFWIRPPEAPEMVFGCLIEAGDLDQLWKDVFATRVNVTPGERPPFVLALLNDKAKPVATFPVTDMARDWKRPFVANEIGEVLPHWEAALYLATPTAMADTARGLRRTLSFTIAGAIALIAIGGWLVVHDVRRQLALAQQKTDFVSNVSHELKTPLTSIRMFAELMHDRPPAPDKQGQYLRIIRVEAERLTRLINNVLDFAKLERRQRRFEKKPLDLCAVITRVWEGQEMHLRDAGFTTRWQAAPGPYPVLGDEDALAQILVNLLSNAEKYSQERKDIELVTWVSGESVNASILDRGIGVPDGEERKIFEAFYRAHDSLSSGIQGSGLGLTLAQRVAREHGGEISFERRQDGGSRFTLRLPLVHQEPDNSSSRITQTSGTPAD